MKKIYIYRYVFIAASICVLITLLFHHFNMLDIVDPFSTGTKIISDDDMSYIIVNTTKTESMVPSFIFAIVGSGWLVTLGLYLRRRKETAVVRYTLPAVLLMISILLYTVTTISMRLFYAKNLFLLAAIYCITFIFCTKLKLIKASDT